MTNPTRRPQISTTISDHTRQQLQELCQLLGGTQSQVIAIALDRLYRAMQVTYNGERWAEIRQRPNKS